jgi:hypothetical protein
VFLTAVAILLLYFRSELKNRSARHNSIDRAVVRLMTKARRPRSPTPRQAARREAINAALWKLLETRSDQQLIAGTAVAVPVYVRLADSANYSVYSFRMATATIFLSCLTHMCTLVAFRNSSKSGGRGQSLVAMAALLVLLVRWAITSLGTLQFFAKSFLQNHFFFLR